MDVITQVVLGSAAAQAALGRRLPRSAWLIGGLAGYLPDADIFIQPPGDPLEGWFWHRHFTHGIGFVPLGALLVTLLFMLIPSLRREKAAVFAAAGVGILTHAPLDAATTFGTLIYWPFSLERISWDLVGIIDPLVTFPLMLGLIWSIKRSRSRATPRAIASTPESASRAPRSIRTPAILAVAWAVFYIGVIGSIQHARVMSVQAQLAQARGHVFSADTPRRALPTPINLVLYRSVYVHNGRVYADQVRVPFFGQPTVWTGSSTPLLTRDDARTDGLTDAQLGYFEKWIWFSQNWVVRPSSLGEPVGTPRVYADARYGMVPNEFMSIFALELPSEEIPVVARLVRNISLRTSRSGELIDLILGRDTRLVPLAQALDASRAEATPPEATKGPTRGAPWRPLHIRSPIVAGPTRARILPVTP